MRWLEGIWTEHASGLGLVLAALLAGAPAWAGEEAGGDSFLDDAKLTLDLRYRYERVDQDGFAETANAHTLRARLGLRTGRVEGFAGLVEVEGTAELSGSFNDTVNGHTAYPVVADPENLELNRLEIAYNGFADTEITLGRQRINLDNQRFVGNVGFRQNEQTFDAVRLSHARLPGFVLTYIYANRVNRVFGERSASGHFNGDVHLANVAYDAGAIGKLAGYAYFLDLGTAPALATQTFGLQFAGTAAVAEGIKILYTAEYAQQSDWAGNAADFSLGYQHGELGLGFDAFTALAGAERLAGDGAVGFSTPLATLHKFQGYADVFLNTPPGGIVDFYARLGWQQSLAGFDHPLVLALAATWHEFDADRGGAHYGSEWDLEASLKIGEHAIVGVKYADFDGAVGFADRNKLWLSVDVSY